MILTDICHINPTVSIIAERSSEVELSVWGGKVARSIRAAPTSSTQVPCAILFALRISSNRRSSHNYPVDTTMTTSSIPPVDTADESIPAGAPEIKIEVTPEMVEAGVDAYYANAYWGWDNPGNDALREMVTEIFKAMSHRHWVRV